MSTIVGIDPGLGGAVAFIYEDGKARVVDTPAVEINSNGKTRRRYDVPNMVRLLVENLNCEVGQARAALEQAHAFPGKSVTSMFQMGVGLGVWQGILGALGIPVSMIFARVWKKAMLSGKAPGKEASRLRALELFPSLAIELGRKKDEGRAEALLMAAYLSGRYALAPNLT